MITRRACLDCQRRLPTRTTCGRPPRRCAKCQQVYELERHRIRQAEREASRDFTPEQIEARYARAKYLQKIRRTEAA